MDIAGLSTAMKTADLQAKVGIAVLSKAMEVNETLGEGLVELIDSAAMELSVNPSAGANVNIRL